MQQIVGVDNSLNFRHLGAAVARTSGTSIWLDIMYVYRRLTLRRSNEWLVVPLLPQR